jgi:hypothetical protein
MRAALPVGWTLFVCAFAATARAAEEVPGAATPTDAERRIEALERRVHELESAREPRAPGPDEERPWTDALPEVLRRFHPAADADVAWMYGERNSRADGSRFVAEKALFVLDADLSEEARLGGRTVFNAASLYFEWDLVRDSELKNQVGSLYVRLDGLFGIDVLNLKLGRFLIPYGEEYVRFSEGPLENPFIGFTAAAPYGWDEGALLFGSLGQDAFFEWKLAIMNGTEEFDARGGRAPTFAGKVTLRPFSWLAASLSGLRTGLLGSSDDVGASALEIAGVSAVPFGSGTTVESLQDGDPVAPDPSPKVRLSAWEADLILEREGLGRIWLGYGQARIDSETSSSYDRLLHYWVAEAVLELRVFAEALDRVYFAARYSACGTFDGSRGYLIEAFNEGDDLGFNTMRVHVGSVGLGFRVTKNVTIKAEYSWYVFDVVRGASDELRADAEDRDVGGVGIAVRF